MIFPRLKQEQVQLEDLFSDLVDTINELVVILEGEVDPQLQNKFEGAQHNAKDVLNTLSTKIRQMISEICSKKLCANRFSRASRASRLVEGAANLAEKKTRLKYLQINLEQKAKLRNLELPRQGWMPFLVLVAVVTSILVMVRSLKKLIRITWMKANKVSSHEISVHTSCMQLNFSRLLAPEPGVLDLLHFSILVVKRLSIQFS